MDIHILPPALKKERKAWLRMLVDLHQQGMEVGGFAQTFWTLALELELSECELSKILNDCLHNPLPPREMEGVKTLDFWTFIYYLCYRSLMSHRSESIAVPPEMSKPAPVDSKSSLSQSRKRRSRGQQGPLRQAKVQRAARSTPILPESAPVLESAPEPTTVYESDQSLVVLEDLTPVVPSQVVLEDLTPVVLSLVVLEDPTLVVSEVATGPPNFTRAAIIKKAIFAFSLWAVLPAWDH